MGLAIACASVTVSLTADAAVIRGTLELPHRAVKAGAKPTDAVVFVEVIPERLEHKLAHKPGAPRMSETHGGFAPRVLPVISGSDLRFENRDRVFHAPFSISPTKHFDLGHEAPRQVQTVRVDTVGVVNVYCGLHSGEAAYLVVVPNHVYTQPASNGGFWLRGLPRGTYTIKAWHPDCGWTSAVVEMAHGKDAVVALKY
jgi:plastocyanin